MTRPHCISATGPAPADGFHARRPRGRAGLLALLACAVLLAGCAGQRTWREGLDLLNAGQTDAGLARLEAAVKEAPGNGEYRIGLAMRRASLINRLYAAGDAALRDGKTIEAEQAWRQVLRYDPQHAMAQQGLDRLAQDARHRKLLEEAESMFSAGGTAQAAGALERLRAVLAANPRQRAALQLKARIEDALARDASTDTRLSASYRKPITLQFNDAPLRSIFDAISRISGLNFFFDKDVRSDAKGTILARGTTVEDAVRVLLLTNQLDQKVLDDNSVLVYPATPQKQKDYQTLVVRSFFLANADVKAVSNAIKTIVKTKDLVTDERLGTIIMRDTADAVKVAERIVALHDLSDPEVMLEVEVVEVKRSRLQELGLQWPGQLTLSPLSSATGSPVTLADLRGISSSRVQAALSNAVVNLNQQDQDANILTNPRIRVRNKEKAKVMIGDRIPVITTTSSTATNFISESVAYVDVGLKLEVEPTVYLDDEVAIKLNLEVSNIVKEVTSKAGTLTYQIGSRGANTVLRLRDGETQVLAGLISDEDRASANKVPGLGEMPVLGRLFGSQRDDGQRSEILLSITPRVVRSLTRPELALAQFDSGTETAVGAPSLRLAKAVGLAASAGGASPAVVPVIGGGGSAAPAVSPGSVAAAPVAPAAVPDARPIVNGAQAVPPGARPGQAPGPVAGFAPAPVAAAPGAARLAWQGAGEVQVGQTVTVVLRGRGHDAWTDLPLALRFDANQLELLSARPGAFFDRGQGESGVLQQPTGTPGQVKLTLQRVAPADEVPGGAPQELLVLSFKALRAGGATAVQLRAAEPLPVPAAPVGLPPDHLLRVLP